MGGGVAYGSMQLLLSLPPVVCLDLKRRKRFLFKLIWGYDMLLRDNGVYTLAYMACDFP